LLDAASLWVFVAAFSHFISPIDLLMAYGLANILAAIPITPGGLGVVEFVLVSMITGFGPTAGEALSGVLAYRAVNFWLPIPFGGLAYASLEFERRPSYRKFQDFLRRRFRLPRSAATTTANTATVSTVSTVSTVGIVGIVGIVDSSEAPAGAGDLSDVGEAIAAPNGAGPSAPVVPEPVPAPTGMARVHSGVHLADSAGIRGPAFGTDPAG
jgi:hypothetical protein